MNKLLIVSVGAVAIVVVALAMLVFLPQHRADIAETAELIASDGNVTRLSLEIADTPEEHRTGLMNRSSLARDAGMLFVFDNDQTRYFWMDNTLIPLDMIFISKDLTIIDIHDNATPLSRDGIMSSGPCRFVLEVNGGMCDAIGIDVGDRVNLSIK
ncbi:MAG: DUF192 domain-containing protein [Methanocella sp.]